jgi:hypothetical protein
MMVAREARESEICRDCWALMLLRDDVVDFESSRGICLGSRQYSHWPFARRQTNASRLLSIPLRRQSGAC